MFRTYTLLALLELALLGACFGIPEAHADPAELCCNDPRHTECSGCILGYQLGPGELYGCLQASPAPGCSVELMECQRLEGQIPKFDDSCRIFLGFVDGVSINKDGCQQTNCD